MIKMIFSKLKMTSITINDQQFQIYNFDSVESIKDRIAVELFDATPVKFLSFEPEMRYIKNNDKFIVKNLLEYFINQKSLDFPVSIFNQFKDKLDRDEIEKFFINTNLELVRSIDDKYNITSYLLSSMRNLTNYNPEDVWKNRQRFLGAFETTRNKLKESVNNYTVISRDFENIPSVEYLQLEPRHNQFSVIFKPSSTITINDLFNRMKLTKFIPYINFTSLYKIKYGFVVNPKWLEYEAPNVIFLKVDSELEMEMRSLKDAYKKFSSVAFSINSTQAGTQIIATLDLSIGPRNVNINELISRVLECVDIPRTQIERIEDTSWTGYCSIKNQTLLIPVWAELAMNNPFFNSMIAVDEFIRPSKIKQNVYMHLISTPSDVISISMQEDEHNNFFIRVRIKSTSKELAAKYQELLARFFTIYNNEKDIVLNNYRQYIPNFMRDEERKIQSRKPISSNEIVRDLKLAVPELFIPSYSRKCLNRPTIISDNLLKEYTQTKKYEVMQYPIFGEGVKKNYICEHETHPFPGLRNNDLENKVQYPYLPCCYTKDQKTKAGSKYLKYFENISTGKKVYKQKPDLFFTDKPLASNMPGVLPPKIKKYFSLIQADAKYCFIRVGSRNTTRSFLEAVLRGLGKRTDPENVRQIFEEKIMTEKSAMAAKQEFFDENIETIIKYMNTNFKASHFVHVIEEVFDVDVFVFSTDSMLIPPYSKFHLKHIPSRKVLLFFQHKKSIESDEDPEDIEDPEDLEEHAEQIGIEDMKHNQCEIIARVRASDEKHINRQYLFEPDDPVIQSIWKTFKRMTKSITLNSDTILHTRCPKFEIVSQHIDSNGKCRLLNIKFNDNIISISCDPLPPFAALQTKNFLNRVKNGGIITEFSNQFDITLIEQLECPTSICEINALMFGTHKITFLVDLPQPLSSIPISDTMNTSPKYTQLFKNFETIISEFGRKEKLVQIIYNYTLFFLSKYMTDRSQDKPLDDLGLVKFAREKTVVIPNYKYEGDISPVFNFSSQFVLNGEKIIMSSNEMLRRILYMIRLYQNTNIKKLLEYHKNSSIENYFENIKDYDTVSNGVLLDGEDTVRNMIVQLTQKQNTTSCVIPETENVYFFKNKKLGNSLYLAQNFKTFEEAENMIASRNGSRNVSRNGSISVYSFVSTTDIRHILGSKKSANKILGYKISGNNMYTSLIKL